MLKEYERRNKTFKDWQFIKNFGLFKKEFYHIIWSIEKGLRKKNRRIMLLSKCTVFDGKKSKFIKEQEVNELLSSLE